MTSFYFFFPSKLTPPHLKTDNFKAASEEGASYDLRKIFDGSLVQSRPMDAVCLVDNHDTQPGQALESWIDPTFKPLAYALILFRGDGYPCVFAGDLYGCDSDPHVDPMNQLADFIRIRKLFACEFDFHEHPYFLLLLHLFSDPLFWGGFCC